ncbi:MAG: hypothetical protein U1F43_31475 [Myxococcota bacterium]
MHWLPRPQAGWQNGPTGKPTPKPAANDMPAPVVAVYFVDRRRRVTG